MAAGAPDAVLVPFFAANPAVLPIVAGGTMAGLAGLGIWAIVDAFKNPKRDGLKSDVIFALNGTALSVEDLHRLNHLRMDTIAEPGFDNAVFSLGDGFTTTGNITGTDKEAANGLKAGGLSFWVPGIDVPVQGDWISVANTPVDRRNKTADASFHETHKKLMKALADM